MSNFLKTSLNINMDKLLLLENVSRDSGFDVNTLITMLLQKMQKSGKLCIKTLETVKYQKFDPRRNWKIQTVYFDSVDYECFFDMRKFFKFSVSFLLSKAIDLFLDSLFLHFDILNYSMNNWFLIKKQSENEIKWEITWKETKKERKNE